MRMRLSSAAARRRPGDVAVRSRGPVRGDVALGAALLQRRRQRRREQRERMNDRGAFGDRLAERRDLVVEAAPVAHHHRRVQAIAACFAERGVERERAVVGGERFVVALGGVERGAEVGPRVGEPRRERGRLRERSDRVGRPVQVVQREAAVRPRFGIAGVDRDRAVGARQRVGEAPEPMQCDAAVAPRRAEPFGERDRGVEALDRVERPLRAVERQPVVVVELGIGRLQRDRAGMARERFVVRPGLARDDAERAVGRGELGCERERAPVRRRRAGRIAGVVEDDAAVEMRLEVVGPNRDAALVARQRAGDVTAARCGIAEAQARLAEQRRDAPVEGGARRERLEQRPRLGEASLATERARVLDRCGDSRHAPSLRSARGEQIGVDLGRAKRTTDAT
jgi:hypothetical protein